MLLWTERERSVMLYAMETQDTRTDEAKSTLKFLEVCSEETQDEFEANE